MAGLIPDDIVVVAANEDFPTAPEQAGVTEIPQEDGTVLMVFEPPAEAAPRMPENHDDNLAEFMDEDELGKIAEELLEGIDADDQSRSGWLADRAKGITLLGLKLEDPRTDATEEGMSVVRHPVLLEAVLRGQANARGELLPATGPVKVMNFGITSSPTPPQAPAAPPAPAAMGAQPQPGAQPPMLPPAGGPGGVAGPPAPAGVAGPMAPAMMGHNGGPPLTGNNDEEADWLEKDLNFYLTAVATEYVPDTDRMLFYVCLGGSGWKKVYNCPLRRRPVSESIDAEHFIVSSNATDLANAPRLTHRIKARQAVMKRMQFLGVYRDVPLTPPVEESTVVDDKKDEVSGVATVKDRPEDARHTLYETHCELELDRFAPEKFKKSGVPLPYRVTIEKDSRKVLELRRNWDENDEECNAKRFYVRYPYVDAISIYAIGLVHILGNPAAALTAAIRIMLDSGMFNSFPGTLIGKDAARGIANNTLRIPPGGMKEIDLQGGDIRARVMSVPSKPLDAAFVQFIEALAQTAQRVGGTADIPVGEGKQDAPVGTTLALIEQATKVESAVHKRLHQAQAEEFELLKERFREDPEAIYRHKRRKGGKQFDVQRFIAALDNCDLVPVADPNTHSHMQRVMRAVAIKQLQAANPGLYDGREVDERILKEIRVAEPDSLFAPPQPAPPPSPQETTAQARMMEAKTRGLLAAIEAATADEKMKIEREKIATDLKKMVIDLARTMAVHPEAAGTVDKTVEKFGSTADGGSTYERHTERSDGGRVI